MSRPLASTPLEALAVPPAVAKVASGAATTAVWRNELGGLTFRVDDPSGDARYVKWQPHGADEIDMAGEAARLRWARQWATVPEVLDQGGDDDGTWLVTRAIDARSAVDPRWLADPVTAAAGIGDGLRRLHEALPVVGCPFSWSVGHRMARVDARLAAGDGPASWSAAHRHLTVDDARDRLALPPDLDQLVVCHGDACVPNTLLHDDGVFAGHVDLGSLGLADRWADLAVAAWSTEWNYGPGHDGAVYDAYGIEPDPERIAYYRLLWDLA